MTPTPTLQERIDGTRARLGALVGPDRSGDAVAAARVGYDLVCIDLATGDGPPPAEVTDDLATIGDEYPGTVRLVRVAGGDPDGVQRAARLPTDGLLVPGVATRKDARVAVTAAASLPGDSDRGTPRPASYAVDFDEFVSDVVDRPFVVAGLRGEQGVAAAGAIAATDGVDAIVTGPTGAATPDRDAPVPNGAAGAVLDSVRTAGRETGVPVGLSVASPDDLDAAFADLDFYLTGGLTTRSGFESAYRTFRRGTDDGDET